MLRTTCNVTSCEIPYEAPGAHSLRVEQYCPGFHVSAGHGKTRAWTYRRMRDSASAFCRAVWLNARVSCSTCARPQSSSTTSVRAV